ncbi:uncharacterized protein FFC1_12041 [Fusarium fujikuroi]|nr:uncharacterized protein FFC1_12041 [Fusarium fujikuroi]
MVNKRAPQINNS